MGRRPPEWVDSRSAPTAARRRSGRARKRRPADRRRAGRSARAGRPAARRAGCSPASPPVPSRRERRGWTPGRPVRAPTRRERGRRRPARACGRRVGRERRIGGGRLGGGRRGGGCGSRGGGLSAGRRVRAPGRWARRRRRRGGGLRGRDGRDQRGRVGQLDRQLGEARGGQDCEQRERDDDGATHDACCPPSDQLPAAPTSPTVHTFRTENLPVPRAMAVPRMRSDPRPTPQAAKRTKFPQFANFFAYMAYPKRAGRAPRRLPATRRKGTLESKSRVFGLSPDSGTLSP